MRSRLITLLTSGFGPAMVLASGTVFAAVKAPANVDSALAKLYTDAAASMPSATVAGVHAQVATVGAAELATTPGRFDSKTRVLVHVYLNGAGTVADVSTALTKLSANVLGTTATYSHGVLAAYLPTDQIANAAALAGVRSLTIEHMPTTRVGKYTSQGAAVLETSALNAYGLKGEGITVGVISDSFNTAQQNTKTPPATTAAQDVASNDLPVVNVLEDYPNGTDEGRAMCQIVHDEAPKSNIAFATAFVSEVDFANNIVNLRTQAGANVIVDDIGYFDEPVFSDGLLAQSVNAVTSSTALAGKPAIYCSSAGNDGNNGYRSAYRNLGDATVRQAGHHGNLKLNVTDPTSPHYLDPSLTAGGWFNWNPNGGTEPSTTVEAPGPTKKMYNYALFLQWDDLFDQDHGITTNYNFLVFDANGNYLPDLSSTTNTFDVQQPLQAIGYLLLGKEYQIAITQTTQTDPNAGPIPATHQLAIYSTLDGLSFLEGKYFYPAPLNVPNIYGHPAADGAIAVAAYAYSYRDGTSYAPELENFTSPGPVTVYFNENYKRLATPKVRLKPEVAGVDGVVTTFFGAPYYGSPYAFFGTSAAAPSIAGVAALVLQAGGGPGTVTVDKMKSLLEGSAAPRNSTVESTQALNSASGGYLAVTSLGQSYFGPSYFTVNYYGGSKNEIDSLTINGKAAGLIFNTAEFELGTTSGVAPASITVTPAAGTAQSFTINFAKGTFTTGSSFMFTVGQDVLTKTTGYTQDELGVGVEAEDLAYGATYTATFGNGKTLTAPFYEGYPTSGYLPSDGFGLVNAISAVVPLLSATQAKTLQASSTVAP